MLATYRVMARGKHNKRFHCYGYHTESYHADKNALALAKSLWAAQVKVIVNDGYTTEELIYK